MIDVHYIHDICAEVLQDGVPRPASALVAQVRARYPAIDIYWPRNASLGLANDLKGDPRFRSIPDPHKQGTNRLWTLDLGVGS